MRFITVCGLGLPSCPSSTLVNTLHFNIIPRFMIPRENIISLMPWGSLTQPNLVLYNVDTHIHTQQLLNTSSSFRTQSWYVEKMEENWGYCQPFSSPVMMVEYRIWTRSSVRWHLYATLFNSIHQVLDSLPCLIFNAPVEAYNCDWRVDVFHCNQIYVDIYRLSKNVIKDIPNSMNNIVWEQVMWWDEKIETKF